jgi:hypothetical protein
MLPTTGPTSADFEKSSFLRTQALSAFGEIEPQILTPVLDEITRAGPQWPASPQSFRVVRRNFPHGGRATLLASDGLSAPFAHDESGRNGFGLECFAATEDPLDRVMGSWLWDLVWQVSQLAAKRGDLAYLLNELGLLSTELLDVNLPSFARPTFLSETGSVGVLLGLTPNPLPKTLPGPRGPIHMVSIKLLTVDETAHVASLGESGRNNLAQLFSGQGPAWISTLARGSVLQHSYAHHSHA